MTSMNWPAIERTAYWAQPVATVGSLPPAGQVIGEIRLVLSTDDLYEWTGSAWIKITEDQAVAGPASATDNAITRFDGTTGKLIQNSTATLSDTGVLAGTSIDASTNTLTNIINTSIKAAAAIALNKLAATTINRALVSDGTGFVSPSSVTATELGYLSGVGSAVQTQLDAKLALAGGTMTGDITLNADPNSPLKAATKQYVDSVAAGLDVKPSVNCAAASNITLSGEQTLDGILTSTSRVLVKGQSAPAQNGIYVSAAGAWTRATDMDSWLEVPGAFCFVEQGTLYADTAFVCSADAGGTIGVTSITWSQFAGAGTYTADGQGIELTGTQFSLELDGGTLTKTASGVRVAAQTINKALVSDGSGNATTSATTATQIGYLSTLASDVQVQIDAVRAVNQNVSISSDTTLTNKALHLVSTAAARSLTLPAPAAALFLVVKDVTGSGQTNNITINPAGAQTIDGSATLVIDDNYKSVTIVSDGSNYFVI